MVRFGISALSGVAWRVGSKMFERREEPLIGELGNMVIMGDFIKQG